MENNSKRFVHIGFDKHETFKSKVLVDVMEGYIIQNPKLMGELAVEAVIKLNDNIKVQKNISTPTRYIQKNSFD